MCSKLYHEYSNTSHIRTHDYILGSAIYCCSAVLSYIKNDNRVNDMVCYTVMNIIYSKKENANETHQWITDEFNKAFDDYRQYIYTSYTKLLRRVVIYDISYLILSYLWL